MNILEKIFNLFNDEGIPSFSAISYQADKGLT